MKTPARWLFSMRLFRTITFADMESRSTPSAPLWCRKLSVISTLWLGVWLHTPRLEPELSTPLISTAAPAAKKWMLPCPQPDADRFCMSVFEQCSQEMAKAVSPVQV